MANVLEAPNDNCQCLLKSFVCALQAKLAKLASKWQGAGRSSRWEKQLGRGSEGGEGRGGGTGQTHIAQFLVNN